MEDNSYYLVCLMEECAEVSQVVAKSLRFGIDDSHPKTGDIPNHELLSRECGDILGVIDCLLDMRVINEDILMQYRTRKPDRIKKYKEMYNG